MMAFKFNKPSMGCFLFVMKELYVNMSTSEIMYFFTIGAKLDSAEPCLLMLP